MYSVILKSQAEKFFARKLDKRTQSNVASKIDRLAQNPFSPITNATKLQDMKSGYRLRIGNVRVVYEIDSTTQRIIVWKIAFRGSAYKP